jgi:type IV pilus assembly protein PilM
VKKITLPVMTESELGESIYWEAEQYIPFDIQDVNLDYQILDPGTGPDSRGSMEVLLVAAKKEKIGDYTGVIAQAGRAPVIVDVDAFALQNAYEMNYGLEGAHIVVLLNAGASAININIIQGDQSVFTRDISIGGNATRKRCRKSSICRSSRRSSSRKAFPSTALLRRSAARAARGDRERAARDPEDVRLLQGDGRVRTDRPNHAERRRVARGRLPRHGAGTLQRAGRGVRSVPRHCMGRQESRR